jgi:SAM-dependent methyltransferase
VTLDLADVEDWHFWFVGRDELVLALLDRFAPPRPSVVDVGCGTGAFASRLAADDRTSAVFAIDRSAPARAGGAPAASADAERLPFADRSVDVVLARDVLEHVDDRAALDEVRRVLRPDGVLIALVPAWPKLWSERDVRAGHRRRYTRQTLRRVLDARGFGVAEIRGYQSLLLPVLVASRLLSRRRPTTTLAAEEAPSPAINRVLARVNRAEASLARTAWLRPPTGSTLAVVARPAAS